MGITLGEAKRTDAYKFEGDAIERLRESEQLVRFGGLDEDHVEHLAQDIAAHGQQANVLVRRGADGEPELVAGRHRRAAILRINADPTSYGLPANSPPIPLKASYMALSEEESIRASFAENTGKPLSVMDLAYAAERFGRFDWDNKRIASILSAPHHKVSADRVSQLRALMKLPHSIQVGLHEGTIKESAARAMLRLEVDAEEMQRLADQIEEGELTAADLTSQANEKRRNEGKKIKRSLNDLRALLHDLAAEDETTRRASDLLAWIDGEVNDPETVRAVFIEEE